MWSVVSYQERRNQPVASAVWWVLVGAILLPLATYLAMRSNLLFLVGLALGAILIIVGVTALVRGRQPGTLAKMPNLARIGGSIPILEVDTQTGEVTWASPAAAELFGKTAQDLHGCRLDELRPAWAQERTRSLLTALSEATEAVYEHTEPWLRSNQEVFWADATALQRAAHPAPRALLSLHEVSDGHALEEQLAQETERAEGAELRTAEHRRELQNAHARADALFHHALEAVLIVEADTYTIREANPQACQLTGYEHEDLVGRSLADLDPTDDLRYYRQLTKGTAQLPQTFVEMPVRRADGKIVNTEAAVAYLEPGEERALQVVMHDNEARQLCGVLEETIARMEQQIQQLELANEDLRAVSQAKSDFLAAMSHEIRTPLNAIVGFSELLETSAGEQLTHRQRQFIADIRSAAEHLVALVNDVLDLAKLEVGRVEVVSEPLALFPLIRGVCSVTMAIAEPKNINLQIDVQSAGLGTVGDERRIKQVLYNLLSNAIEYSPADTQVWVTAQQEGDLVRVSVRDQGPGIALEYREQIFEEFERLPHGEQPSGARGTGLGLSLSQQLIEAMGGQLTVESEVGEGSTFSFTLPVYEPPEAEVPDEEQAEPGKSDAEL